VRMKRSSLFDCQSRCRKSCLTTRYNFGDLRQKNPSQMRRHRHYQKPSLGWRGQIRTTGVGVLLFWSDMLLEQACLDASLEATVAVRCKSPLCDYGERSSRRLSSKMDIKSNLSHQDMEALLPYRPEYQ